MVVYLENETPSLYNNKFNKIKTKIVEKTLNPSWEEVFHIKVKKKITFIYNSSFLSLILLLFL